MTTNSQELRFVPEQALPEINVKFNTWFDFERSNVKINQFFNVVLLSSFCYITAKNCSYR